MRVWFCVLETGDGVNASHVEALVRGEEEPTAETVQPYFTVSVTGLKVLGRYILQGNSASGLQALLKLPELFVAYKPLFGESVRGKEEREAREAIPFPCIWHGKQGKVIGGKRDWPLIRFTDGSADVEISWALAYRLAHRP